MVHGDLIQRITGGFGRYQLGLCLVVFCTKFFVAFHQMAILFLAPKVSFSCGLNGTETCPCADPVYDTSLFTRSIIMEWDLICDRRWLTSFTQTIFQLGVLLGSVIFGMASDRWYLITLFYMYLRINWTNVQYRDCSWKNLVKKAGRKEIMCQQPNN